MNLGDKLIIQSIEEPINILQKDTDTADISVNKRAIIGDVLTEIIAINNINNTFKFIYVLPEIRWIYLYELYVEDMEFLYFLF